MPLRRSASWSRTSWLRWPPANTRPKKSAMASAVRVDRPHHLVAEQEMERAARQVDERGEDRHSLAGGFGVRVEDADARDRRAEHEAVEPSAASVTIAAASRATASAATVPLPMPCLANTCGARRGSFRSPWWPAQSLKTNTCAVSNTLPTRRVAEPAEPDRAPAAAEGRSQERRGLQQEHLERAAAPPLPQRARRLTNRRRPVHRSAPDGAPRLRRAPPRRGGATGRSRSPPTSSTATRSPSGRCGRAAAGCDAAPRSRRAPSSASSVRLAGRIVRRERHDD